MAVASAQQSEGFFNSELFADVQLSSLFTDSKTFADAIPKQSIEDILQAYAKQKQLSGFILSEFVQRHFIVRDTRPIPTGSEGNDSYRDISQQHSEESSQNQVLKHIEGLWDQLTQDAKNQQNESVQPHDNLQCSLISLPQRYIIPGGRFQEIYYWDTYFTALGLALDGKHQLILDTFKNFQFLIADNGCIPNGNRDYYRGRSQPPVLALLYQLLQEYPQELPETTSDEFKTSALNSLLEEYEFWMSGCDAISTSNQQQQRVVRMPDGSILNRYWDSHSGPRPESFKEDLEMAESLNISNDEEFYRHIRAACESGWDFSSRWLAEPQDLSSIRTCDIVPVDLNCLLYFLEDSLARLHTEAGLVEAAQRFAKAAEVRDNAMQHYFWNSETGFYHDYCLSESCTTNIKSLAATLPLFFQLASQDQAALVSEQLANCFLKPGGLVTTLTSSPEQWDSPNGWAPLQWFAVIALENYGFEETARSVMNNWLANIELCFSQHPGMMEKYNVETCGTAASGGEYQVQEGFGWTNGVTRAFYAKTQEKTKSE